MARNLFSQVEYLGRIHAEGWPLGRKDRRLSGSARPSDQGVTKCRGLFCFCFSFSWPPRQPHGSSAKSRKMSSGVAKRRQERSQSIPAGIWRRLWAYKFAECDKVSAKESARKILRAGRHPWLANETLAAVSADPASADVQSRNDPPVFLRP